VNSSLLSGGSPSTSSAAIGGGVGGGIVALIIIGGVLFYCLYWKKRNQSKTIGAPYAVQKRISLTTKDIGVELPPRGNSTAPIIPKNKNMTLEGVPEESQEARAVYDFPGKEHDEIPLKRGDLIKLLSSNPKDDWWKGRTNGKTGIFPRTYVELVQVSTSPINPSSVNIKVPLTNTKSVISSSSSSLLPPITKQLAEGLFDFAGNDADELPFATGDTIQLTKTPESEQWWEGTHTTTGRTGIFPRDYVKLLGSASTAPTRNSQSVQRKESRIDMPTSPTINGQPPLNRPQTTTTNTGQQTIKELKIMDSIATAIHQFDATAEDELSFKVGDQIRVTGEVNGWYLGKSVDGLREGIFPCSYVDIK